MFTLLIVTYVHAPLKSVYGYLNGH